MVPMSWVLLPVKIARLELREGLAGWLLFPPSAWPMSALLLLQ
jgi:hypothetical protein